MVNTASGRGSFRVSGKMSKTYKVFVCSTFSDLQAAREAAIAGIVDRNHIPISLDTFVPENASDMDVIQHEVNSSDVFLLILGPRHGGTPSGRTKGFTEIEYDVALDAGKYMMIFALPWDEVLAWREENLDPSNTKDREEITRLDDLKKFYERVKRGGNSYTEWSLKPDSEGVQKIRHEVAAALTALSNRKDAPKESLEAEGTTAESVAQVIAARTGIDAELAPDGQNLLAVALTLLPQKTAEKDVLSSSTLFLAAIEWGLGRGGVVNAPGALRSLAQTFDSLSEGQYGPLQTEFFLESPPTIKLEVEESEISSFRLSENFEQAFRECAKTATGSITAADLVRSVLRHVASPAYSGTRFRDRLAKLKVSASVLEMALLPGASTHAANDLWTVDDKLGYSEYARAIYHFLRDPRTSPPLTISIQAPWGGGKTSLMRMIQRELDPTGYERARTGTRSLESPLDGAPAKALLKEAQAIAKGKPSDIRIDMGEEGGFPTIWFNAWIYQSGKQTWAGLGEAIVRSLCERLDPIQRERFLLRLHLARVDPHAIRRKIYEAATQHFLGYLRGGLKWVLALVVLITAAAMTGLGHELDLGRGLLGWVLSGSVLSGATTALVGYAIALFKTKSEPAQFSLSNYLDVPEYGKELGFVHQVNNDLRRILDILPSVKGPDGESRQAPIVLFIDDLDRCSPVKIAEVFEAINLFIAGEFPNCYVILGMDSEIVAAALEEAHKQVVSRLPAYSRQTAVGWRYMDKFVQLPFVIPPIDADAVKSFAAHLAVTENLAATKAQERAASLDRQVAEDSIARIQTEVTDPEQVARRLAAKHELEDGEGEALAREMVERSQRMKFIDERAQLLSQDSSEIEALLQQAHMEFSNNPRELKRLVNVYRFYMNLRLAREARGQSVPTTEQMRNWVMLMLAWPEVFRWLRRSHTEWEIGAREAGAADTGRLLKELEELAVTPIEKPAGTNGQKKKSDPTMEDWTSGLESRSGLTRETPWFVDERLFHFFQRVATAGPRASLAAGAGRGFW